MDQPKHADFGGRLTALIEKHPAISDMTKLSKATGINYEMIRRYTGGVAKPRRDNMQLIADALGTTLAYLDYGETPEMIIESIRALDNTAIDYGDDDGGDIASPVYDVIFCCGDGNGADFSFEEIKGYRKFSPSFFNKKGVKPENFKLLCARNDSQHPYINDGDIVGIDIADTEIRDGEMYAILLDGERMFKQIFREGGGVFRLHCYNPAYPDKFIDHTNGKSLKIVGRQVYRAG